jgi:hypothetical protein
MARLASAASMTCSIACGMLSSMATNTMEAPMDQQEKARENRLRRMAERQGLVLRKPRRRDTRALDYGELWLMRFWVEDESGRINAVLNPEGSDDAWLGPFRSLDELEVWLTSDPKDRPDLADRRAAGPDWLRTGRS